MGSADLEAQVLRRLSPTTDPNVLIGTTSPDDAGVYRINDDTALVMTVDFFTPVVDDPRAYGEVAAANSLSDVYAMGGEPFAALNVAAFPAASAELPLEILGDILAGGSSKAAEAGVAIIGGHTVDDSEPKYGLAVVGRVAPDAIVKKQGVRRGDLLVLTKPLGTGILTTALKQEKCTEDDLAETVRVMSTLNRDAARAMLEGEVHAATDITGYGLLGHLREMLKGESVGAALSVGAIPLLAGARELAGDGAVPGGTKKNLLAARPDLAVEEGVGETDLLLLADAQTSGGLLIATDPDSARDLVQRLSGLGTPAAHIVGEIVDGEGIRIEP